MKKNMVNTVHLEGYLYSHSLDSRVTGENSKNPNTPYISGNIDIATDDAMTNVISVHFTYATPTYGSGKNNPNYSILADIISGKVKNATEHGKEFAAKLRVDSAIGLNEFYSDRNGEEELVSVKRNEGGFIHIVTVIADENNEKTKDNRNRFDTDIIITGVRHIDADEERGLSERAAVKGCIFDFRKAILPVEFVVTNPLAINYFEGLEASSQKPVFTRVWGKEIATTIVRKVERPSAFGEPLVTEVPSTRREFVITGANPEPYDWDDESTITAAELKNAMADRQTTIATLKKNREDYLARTQGGSTVDVGEFKF